MKNRTLSLKIFISFLILIAAFFILHNARTDNFGAIDLCQYWAAVKLWIEGGNPYSAAALDEIQRNIPVKEHPIIMWNPPIILPLFAWFYWLDFQFAVSIWILFSLCMILLSAAMLLKVFPLNTRRTRFTFYLVLCTFYPYMLTLLYGQISALLVLSLSSFLFLARGKKSITESFSGGLALGIGLIKPHLLFLVYTAIGLESLRTRKLHTVAGMGIAATVLFLTTLLVSPDVLLQYIENWGKGPVLWKTPTLGSWLQAFTGIHELSIRIIPSIIAVVTLAALQFRGWFQCKYIKDITLIVPLSLVFSPYGWTYDQLLLLPIMIFILSRTPKIGGSMLLVANLVMMATSSGTGQEWMIWFPPVYLLIALGYNSILIPQRERD